MFIGRKVLITGATGGIGEALAQAFYSRGAFLILTGRNRAKLKELAGRFGKDCCMTAFMDMSDSENIEKAASSILKKHPEIDILINNAGVTQRSLIAETDLDVYRTLMQVDFMGPLQLTKMLLPQMIERGSGHIVSVSSVIGKFSTPMRSGYAAAKMALGGWMDSLRAEVWKNGIDVTTVFPGAIKTNVSLNALDGSGKAHGRMDSLQQKGMSAEACAEVIVRGILKKRREIIVGVSGSALFGLVLSRWCPGLLARILRKAKVT